MYVCFEYVWQWFGAVKDFESSWYVCFELLILCFHYWYFCNSCTFKSRFSIYSLEFQLGLMIKAQTISYHCDSPCLLFAYSLWQLSFWYNMSGSDMCFWFCWEVLDTWRRKKPSLCSHSISFCKIQRSLYFRNVRKGCKVYF